MSELRRLRGVLLVLVIALATLWLGASGRLALYIHPRYDVFTLVMAGIAVAGCVAAIVAAFLRARRSRGPRTALPLVEAGLAPGHDDGHDDHGHDHDGHDHDAPPSSRAGRALGAAAIALSAALTATMVLLPPATLTSATATQRDIAAGSGVVDAEADAAALAAAEDASTEAFAAFTVRDWAGLLRQTSDPSFYAGKPVDVVGFVTEHPDDAGLFYVSRFAITCCAVDAQPYGVPVALPGWEGELSADDWVRVTGEFASAAGEGPAIVLEPVEVTRVDEPAEPYLF